MELLPFGLNLFIVSLAFEDDSLFQYTDKLAILIGSVASGIFWLFGFENKQKHIDNVNQYGTLLTTSYSSKTGFLTIEVNLWT